MSSMPLLSAAPANRLVHSSSTWPRSIGQLLERHLAGADLRQIEQVVDDLQQDLRRRANRLREVRLRRRQRRARQELRHADHAVHRRAQLVAHAIEEVALRARRFGELPIALRRARACAAALRPRGARAPRPSRGIFCRWRRTRCPTNASDRERIERVGQRRRPRRGIAVDRQAQRRLAPHRIGVGRAHFEHVIAGVEIRQRDAALRAEIDPVVGQAASCGTRAGCASAS